MLPQTGPFEFDYFGSDIVYGRGRVGELGDRLNEYGYGRALVVCGSNVGANEALMGPLRNGLYDCLVGVFDETTPAKSVETVYDGIAAMDETDPDVIVGVGGGSSLDIARQMSVFAADGRSLASLRTAAREGDVDSPNPAAPLTPVVVVPTTFAGADLSSGGSIEVLSPDESPTAQPVRASGSLTPDAVVYDPDLFETTPMGALAGSAMNGFDKGLETIYSPDATPITDSTSVHGVRLLSAAFPRLGTGDPGAMESAVQGILLVQFQRKASIIHAVGHGFARRYPVQQGLIHATVAPHVLRYVLNEVDARRELLAEAFGIDTRASDGKLAEAIVEAVTEVRDSFDLPTRLRDYDPIRREDFQAVAEFTLEDALMQRAPAGLDPTVKDLEGVFDAAW